MLSDFEASETVKHDHYEIRVDLPELSGEELPEEWEERVRVAL